MNISYIVNPYVTSGVIALAASAALVWLAWSSRAGLSQLVDALRKKLFSRSGFFWTVNIIFMAVSVIHAGVFFGITGNSHDVPGVALYLGFAVSFFLDLVTIILMQALLEAKYRSDEPRARQFLIFIIICCGTSTFANLAISLNDFDAAIMLPYAPDWIQIAAPYVLASFPLFVILMSIAAEMIVNVRPLDSLEESEYEADEKKRVKLMQIRNDYLQRQADEELRTLTIRAQMKMNKAMRSGRLPRSFRWPWETAIDIDAVVAGVSGQMKAIYEPQIEALQRQLAEVKDQLVFDTPEDSQNDEIPDTEEWYSSDNEEAIEQTEIDTSIGQSSADESEQSSDKDAPKPAARRRTKSSAKDSEKKRKAERLLRSNPTMSAAKLADKVGIARSYASQIKADFIRGQNETSKPEPKTRNTDELPITNGHRKVTQPLDLVPLEV